MGEGVTHQQLTEFVVNAWNWNGEARKNCQPQRYHHRKEKKCAEKASARQRLKAVPDCMPDSLARPSEEQLQKQENAAGNQRLIEAASQRLQIRRVGTDHCKHAEDDTG